MSTDFFDDDLVRKRDRPAATVSGDPSVASGDVPARPVSELNLTRMAKRKDEMTGQAESARREIERLRRRQEDLERERQSLEDMTRKQDEYERVKREMLDNLDQSIVLLEKQEFQAARLAEMYAGTRQRFKELLREVQAVDESQWPEESIREELNKAFVLMDDARKEYHKAMAKLEAAGGTPVPADIAPMAVPAPVPGVGAAPTGFGHWVKVGLAVTLPLAVTLVALFVVYLILSGGHLM